MCGLVPPFQSGIVTTMKRSVAASTSPTEISPERRSISFVGPTTSENPRTSSRLPTTLPVSDPRTTSTRPSLTAKSAMISSGALPKVALRKPPIPGPGLFGRVLGRLPDQPRERDERDRGEREQRDVAHVEREPDDRS